MKKILFILIPLISGCYYDSEEDLYAPKLPCDVSNVTYTSKIKPIIDQYCVDCHNPSNSLGGLDLSTYDLCKNSGINGSLYGSMSHNQNFSAMPKGGNKLDDCILLQIQTWINNQYPN